MYLTCVSTLYWRTSTLTKVPAVMGTVVCCSAPFMVKVMKRSPLGSIQNLTIIILVTDRYQYPEHTAPGVPVRDGQEVGVPGSVEGVVLHLQQGVGRWPGLNY